MIPWLALDLALARSLYFRWMFKYIQHSFWRL